MDEYIPTYTLNKVKDYEQDNFVMGVDHTRQRIDFRPLEIREVYNKGSDLIYEWYAKSFYHFINFNSALLCMDLIVEGGFTPDGGGNLTADTFQINLPYNSSSFIEQQDLMYGQVLLNQIKDYNEIVPYLMAVRDKKDINDAKTLRNSNTQTIIWAAAGPLVLAETDQILEEPFRSTVTTFTVNGAAGINTYQYMYRLNIPLFSILEDAKLLPIYNLADPLRMVIKFKDVKKMIGFASAGGLGNVAIPTFGNAYLSNAHLYMDVFKVEDPKLLDRKYYSFKSISYDVWGPRTFGPMNVMLQNLHFNQSFSARWKNLKNALIFFRNTTKTNDAVSEKTLGTLFGIKDIFGTNYDPDLVWTFANYNYPYQNHQDSVSCLWWEFLQYFGMADNNGVEDTRVITFTDWWNSFGVVGIDFSTLPQLDQVISGINTKQEVLTLDFDFNVNRGIRDSMSMKMFFGRNVFFIIADGVIGKIE